MYICNIESHIPSFFNVWFVVKYDKGKSTREKNVLYMNSTYQSWSLCFIFRTIESFLKKNVWHEMVERIDS